MATLDTRPEPVDLLLYGGDTFTLVVQPATTAFDGLDWSAQIRGSRDAAAVDAEFTITPPGEPGGPAYLTLDSETTTLLVNGGAVIRRRVGREVRAIQQYLGEWDCQVSAAGDDPVRTLVQGTITIELDVTRAVGP